MTNLVKILKSAFMWLMGAVFSLLLLYLLWLLARVFLLDVFVIPTNSMLPTLQPGDRLLVCKTIVGPRLYRNLDIRPVPTQLQSMRLKGLRQVRRGDVVVFNGPQHDAHISFLINHVYAKRCLAVPGDSIAVVDGRYVNSRQPGALGLVEEQARLAAAPDSVFTREVFYVHPFDAHVPWTVKNMGPIYVPCCGDVVLLTPLTATYLRQPIEWELQQELRIDWERGEVRDSCGRLLTHHTFGHNYYFMAGDNVCDSNDSRYWGLVPEQYIIGVAQCVLYGRDSQTGRLRRHRFMRSLK